MFEMKTRDNGTTYTVIKDDAPEWVRETVMTCHQGAYPNDWVYETCAAVFAGVAYGAIETEDDISMFADSHVDVYTVGLYHWAADMCLTNVFAEAEEEATELCTIGVSIEVRIKAIQYCAIRTIAQTCLAAIEANS